MLLRVCIDDYLRHIQFERNLSPSTVSQYTRDLDHWLEYLEQHRIPLDTDAIDLAIMRRWLQDISASGKKPPTITRMLCCVRSFWKFVRRYHDIEHDPMSPLMPPKYDRKLPQTVKRSEVIRLFQACDQSHYRYHRVLDKAILGVLVCLGLRRQEIIDIQLQDVNLEDRTLLVRSGKRARERLVPLPDDLIALILDWLQVRPDCDHPYLFLSRHHTKLNPKALERMLARLSKHAGIQPRPRLHMFRHYAATAMVQQSGIENARRLLGHQSPETTSIYTHLSVDDLRPSVMETAALSGIGKRNAIADRPVTLDGTTELALLHLNKSLEKLPDGWRQDAAVIRHLVTVWTAQVAASNEAAYPLRVVEEIFWERQTMAGISFDQHMQIGNFADVVHRHLVAYEMTPPSIDQLLVIAEDINRGVHSLTSCPDDNASEIDRIAEALGHKPEHPGAVGALQYAAKLSAALEPFTVDVERGKVAVQILLGLATWGSQLPVLIIPAAERQLWRLLQQRFLVGDSLPLVAYGIAKLTSLVDDLQAMLGDS